MIPVAVVGWGGSARNIHAPLIAGCSGLTITDVVARSASAAADAEGRLPNATLHRDIGAALASDAELFVIATPDPLHVDMATAALQSRRHVVVEKPLATTIRDASGLARLARERGVILSTFQNRRWDGDFLTVRHLLDTRALGRIARVESTITRFTGRIEPTWREQPRAGHLDGKLVDIGTHLVDQALIALGPVTSVYAEVDVTRPDSLIGDDVFLALTHANGIRSHHRLSTATAARHPRFVVTGATASYVKWGSDSQDSALRAGKSPHAPAFGAEDRAMWGEIVDADGVRTVETQRGRWLTFYEMMVEAIRSVGPNPVPPSDSIAALRVLEAASQSHRLGEVISLA